METPNTILEFARSGKNYVQKYSLIKGVLKCYDDWVSQELVVVNWRSSDTKLNNLQLQREKAVLELYKAQYLNMFEMLKNLEESN